MPTEDSPEPYIPSTSEIEFPLRSDGDFGSENPFSQLDREMQEEDQILSDDTSDDEGSEAQGMLNQARAIPDVSLEDDMQAYSANSSYSCQRQRSTDLADLKLDVPILTSPLPDDTLSDHTGILWGSQNSRGSSSTDQTASHSASKAVDPGALPLDTPDPNESRNSIFHGVSPNTFLEQLAPCAAGSENDDFDEVFDEGFFKELLRLTDAAEADVEAVLHDEQIMVLETLLKYPVPQLERISIIPPWRGRGDDFLGIRFDGMEMISSDEAGLQEDKRMKWEALPSHLMQLGIDDTIEDDGKLSRWVAVPREIVKSEELLFKRPGLCLLNSENDSDEEIEEQPELAEESPRPRISRVLGKRNEHPHNPQFQLPVKKLCAAGDDDMQDLLQTKRSMKPSWTNISTSNALGTFLDLRGGKFKRAALPQPTTNELFDDPIQPTQTQQSENSLHHVPDNLPWLSQTDSVRLAVQVPSTPEQERFPPVEKQNQQLAKLGHHRAIVFETTILQRHSSLISFLETNGKDDLSIVYREMGKIGRDNNPCASPDMILNPKTGLIFTSLQALSQKSLPGQGSPGQGLVQRRVLQLAQEYSRLLVVIAAPNVNGKLAQAQLDTMSTFIGTCARISKDGFSAVPVWVASSGSPQMMDTVFNACVWNLICQHAFPEENPLPSSRRDLGTVALINEESVWERFLRRVGCNVMAAQVLIGLMKMPDPPGGNLSGNTNWGLRRFVQMTPYERRRMFEEIVGSGAMGRVNRMLDEIWVAD